MVTNSDRQRLASELNAEPTISGKARVFRQMSWLPASIVPKKKEEHVFRPDARIDANMVSLYLAAGIPVPKRLLPNHIPGQNRYESEQRDRD